MKTFNYEDHLGEIHEITKAGELVDKCGEWNHNQSKDVLGAAKAHLKGFRDIGHIFGGSFTASIKKGTANKAFDQKALLQLLRDYDVPENEIEECRNTGFKANSISFAKK